MTATVKTGKWSTPDAGLILPSGADRAVWLAARRDGIGGSDASTVAGVNPYSSRYALWLDKTGRAKEKPQTDAMEWGLRLEPVIQKWFTDTTGIAVRKAGLMYSKTRPWQRVSLDGLTEDGGICEWKTTSWRTTDAEIWLDGDVPDHAELQTQHGMSVTGRSHAHVVVLIDGRTPLHTVIERDNTLIDTLIDLERGFWFDHVVADVEPPIDGSPATTEALKVRYAVETGEVISADLDVRDLIQQLAEAKEATKAAELVEDELANRLRAKFGHATALAITGEVVATLCQNGTFSQKRFAADYPDLVEEFQTLAPAFDLARLKDEEPDLYTAYRARVLRTPKPAPVKGI